MQCVPYKALFTYFLSLHNVPLISNRQFWGEQILPLQHTHMPSSSKFTNAKQTLLMIVHVHVPSDSWIGDTTACTNMHVYKHAEHEQCC